MVDHRLAYAAAILAGVAVTSVAITLWKTVSAKQVAPAVKEAA